MEQLEDRHYRFQSSLVSWSGLCGYAYGCPPTPENFSRRLSAPAFSSAKCGSPKWLERCTRVVELKRYEERLEEE